jgi:hypothetical protein
VGKSRRVVGELSATQRPAAGLGDDLGLAVDDDQDLLLVVAVRRVRRAARVEHGDVATERR